MSVGDPRQRPFPISQETFILHVAVGVRPLSPTPKARTGSSLSHVQQGPGTQSSPDQSACLLPRFLNVEDDQIFSHTWSLSSDRTEKYRRSKGHGEVLTRQYLAAFPDAFSDANSSCGCMNYPLYIQ